MIAYMLWHPVLFRYPEQSSWETWINMPFGNHTDRVIQTICRSPLNYTPRELAGWHMYAIKLTRIS